MLDEWQRSRPVDAEAEPESRRALEQRWNTTPHPFFAGLTPAQVMVGGGLAEAKLADKFLDEFTQMFDGQPYESEGDALRQTLMLLRGWECQPRRRGLTPREIILAEHNELLARRVQLLA
jgi:hypothetical protein